MGIGCRISWEMRVIYRGMKVGTTKKGITNLSQVLSISLNRGERWDRGEIVACATNFEKA